MKEPMMFKLEKELKQKLEESAKQLGISKSAFIRLAIIEKIEEISHGTGRNS